MVADQLSRHEARNSKLSDARRHECVLDELERPEKISFSRDRYSLLLEQQHQVIFLPHGPGNRPAEIGS
jgi:hypothetical protein